MVYTTLVFGFAARAGEKMDQEKTNLVKAEKVVWEISQAGIR